MILELTKGEIFELMVSALGGFLLLCKWMKSTNMRKVREYLEKQPLDGLSDCSCLGNVDERFKKLKARRADGGNAGNVGEHGKGTDTERFHYPEEGQRNTNTARITERIAELMREAEQREQSRERTSLKERIEANKRIVAEREREKEKSRQHNRGMSR